MADVKWIKLTTNMFDNRKIKHLRRLPDGNCIVLIWVMLLTMAGRCNANGMIFLTENIPYTPKMLADELGFEENTVQLALKALEQFDMIVMDGDFFTIAGWEEYQNIEGMEKIREQGRARVAKYREKQKLLSGNVTCNVTGNATVTQRNAIEEEKERRNKNKKKDIEKRENTKREKPEKHKRGEYQHVLLSDEEEDKLIEEYGMTFTLKAITFLDEYIEETGYKRQNHYLCIKRWVIDAVKEKEEKAIKQGKTDIKRYGDFDPAEAFERALQRSYSDDDDETEAPKTIGSDVSVRERAEALREKLST